MKPTANKESQEIKSRLLKVVSLIYFEVVFREYIIVWRLGGFGLVLGAEYGFCKNISGVYDRPGATRLQEIGI